MLDAAGELRERLAANTAYFREKMVAAGFEVRPGVHPICPVMLHDAPLAQKFAQRLLEEGIYAIGFFFPVVPKDQRSEEHTSELQSLMRISYAVFCLKKKKQHSYNTT